MAFLGVAFTFCQLGGDFHPGYCLVQENRCGFDGGSSLCIDLKLRIYIIAGGKAYNILKVLLFFHV